MGASESALYMITQKGIAIFLQIVGNEKNFPRAAVFSPTNYGDDRTEACMCTQKMYSTRSKA
jgi:hypothetical protein